MSDVLNEPPSHALVWYKEKNNIAVVGVKKLYNYIVPDDGKNFVRDKFIQVKKKKLKVEAILLAVGSNTEMDEASADADLLTQISHALVLFINSHELAVVEVDNIQQFCGVNLKHHLQYLERNIYHAKKEDNEDYNEVYIYTLGDSDTVMEKWQEYKDNIDSALVRFLEDSSLQVISTNSIDTFDPADRSDFQQSKMYKAKNEDVFCSIQILRLGCFDECASFIDSYNKITHALVAFKPKNNKEVISISNIHQFQSNPPETVKDFDKNALYSGRLTPYTKYSAVQIFALGEQQMMDFDRIHALKRCKFIRFNSSDVVQYNRSASDISKENASSESEDGNTTDESRGKSRTEVKDKETSKVTDSDGDFDRRHNVLMKYPLKDITNKENGNKNQVETEEHEALNERIDSHVSGNKGSTRPPSSHTKTVSSQVRPRTKPLASDVDDNLDDDGQSSVAAMKILPKTSQRQRKRLRKTQNHHSKIKTKRNMQNQQVRRMTDQERFKILCTDSDSDDGTTDDYEVFEPIDAQIGDNEQVVRYIHVGWGYKILYKDWKKTKTEATDEYSFISLFVDALYGRQVFEIFLQIKPFMQVVQEKPRREVTPNEIKVIKQCLKYWIRAKCTELLKERSIDQILRTTRKILSDKISAEFKKYKAKKPKECSYISTENFITNEPDENV